MILHRYIKDKWGLDIIKNLRLHLSNPLNLNDPFEFKVAFAESRISDVKEDLGRKKTINILHEEYGQDKESLEDFGQRLKRLNQDPNRLSKTLEEAPIRLRKSIQKTREEHFKTFRILCFVSPEKTTSEKQQKYNEMLMWSHYANSHEGLRFHFENNEFDFINENFDKIDYKDEMCQLHPFKSDTWEKSFEDASITKSNAWSYENEYRYFFPTNKCKKVKDNYYIDIPPNSIKRIDIGLKCSESLQDEVIELIKTKNKLRHVDLFKANIHESKYELIYDKLQ